LHYYHHLSGLDIKYSALVINFIISFSNELLYRADRTQNTSIAESSTVVGNPVGAVSTKSTIFKKAKSKLVIIRIGFTIQDPAEKLTLTSL
jgi:hypothetical protein